MADEDLLYLPALCEKHRDVRLGHFGAYFLWERDIYGARRHRDSPDSFLGRAYLDEGRAASGPFLRAREGQRSPRVRNGSGERAREGSEARAKSALSRGTTAEHRSRDASFVITHHVVSYFPFLFSPSLSLSRRLGRALPDPRRRLHSLLQPPLLTPASFIDRP